MQAATFRNFEIHRRQSDTAGDYGAVAPLLELALAETHAQGAYLHLFDPARASARLVAWAGLSPGAAGALPDVRGGTARGHFGRTFPIVLQDGAWSDPRFESLSEFRHNRFTGVASMPLPDSGVVVGMANICRSRKVALQPRELSFLLGLSVPIAALVAGTAARFALRQEVENLNRQLADRKLLERAKGLLQVRHRFSEEQAYFYIRAMSRRRRAPMRDVAIEVIEAGA